MTPIAELLFRFRKDWQSPRVGRSGPLSLVCRFSAGLSDQQLSAVFKVPLPPELTELWNASGDCFLFLDHEYGQWGLHLLSPFDAENETSLFGQERARDAMPGDLVIGTFLGDSDLLLIRCDPNAGDFGHLIVATPLDRRADWHVVSTSLGGFLKQYEAAEGAKFWEPQRSPP